MNACDLTLKNEATKPAASNFLQQQDRFDQFIDYYNNELRPHQALDMKYPAELYAISARPYKGLGELDYPFHDWTATVTCCGRICYKRRKINLSTVFAGQKVGVKHVSDNIWQRKLHAVQSRILRSRNLQARAHRKPVQCKSAMLCLRYNL